MIVDERMVTYINSLDKGNTPFLNELEKEALANYVPIIRRVNAKFFKGAFTNKSTFKDFRGRNCSWFFYYFNEHIRTKRM